METLGGCLSKIPKQVLEGVIATLTPVSKPCTEALVGFGTSDDAAVYQLNANQAVVVTADFFPPMVDDLFLFGQIAATNALSDIYAMGAKPLLALNLVCFPEGDSEGLKQMLQGGLVTLEAAGVPLLGGHSIHDTGIKYGLVVVGLVSPKAIWRNDTANLGDALLLTKPLGTGILTGAWRSGYIEASAMEPVWNQMTTLNDRASQILQSYAVNAATDITGFGLLGHLAEMLPNHGAVLDAFSIPTLPLAVQCAQNHFGTKPLWHNRQAVGSRVVIRGVPEPIVEVCYDPQTSGGLLVAISPNEAKTALQELKVNGVDAAIIGRVSAGNKIELR